MTDSLLWLTSKMKGSTLRVPPPALTLLCLFGLVLFRWILSGLTFKFSGQVFVSIILVVVGIAIGLIAIRRFYQVDTTVLPDEMDSSSVLVTGGIFKISRNPMYLGMATVITGVGVGLGTWVMLPILGLFVFWITENQIKPEEHALVKIFGKEFEDYKSKVRRWI
jgi:protein-S-isoprenylcysteine O-methyltransferase Ste14|tara:strand:+ start:577 stop:1071 length:495 start_codon:yes stop_codon:yes gene_type:complete